MTTQPPEADRLHVLLNRLLRSVLLPEECEQLAGAVRELEQRYARLTHIATVACQQTDALWAWRADPDPQAALTVHLAAEDRIRDLEAEVARLTAGQCTHTRAMCEQHHTTPVAGCPYPRCRAARDRDQRAATA
ncbi:hypothetical protein DBP19_35930 [Streptomyces sp. CS090A]|uniref:hypothetical protein n=1 Tax=Streptomyces sp. CS090A TaxID=2162710 RepID=UPI000D519806|nr:hypothetical protein [Streptomyces sp. CS090A]PVC80529.1 hypothetical protein DBP19_35930 [Streptomyces sp. CS090A]